MINRRRVFTGSAAAAALWSAPAITSMDRVAAAVGSCGLKPLQVDLSRWAGAALPGTFTSDDGSVTLTHTINDPSGVRNATYTGNVFNGTLNGRTYPVFHAMSGDSLGIYQSMTITFSTPAR
jgi:hypothetical protein